jgi:uncharacterized repeat protein (TIGR01451 family)
MKATENEKRDWSVIALILLFGLVCILVAGGWALRFAPGWELDASVESRLDPNSEFLTRRPGGLIEPIDPAILTNPAWIDVFLTPGASFSSAVTRVPAAAGTSFSTQTPGMSLATQTPLPTITGVVTNTPLVSPSPTNTFVYFPLVSTSTSKPSPVDTATPIPTESPMPSQTSTTTATATSTPTFTLTPSNTPDFSADLAIANDDGATTYIAGGILTYTIVVTNYGPGDVTGAVVTGSIAPQIMTWSWACSSQNNGASGCDPAIDSSMDFSDTVDLPNGASIVYTVTANISGGASGDLSNTSNVSLPVGYTETAPGNNYATDTDQIITANPFPNGNIGTSNDGSISTLAPGSAVTLTFGTPVSVGSHAGYDLVYYELSAGTGIMMDHVILQISDGYNWYTILNWGDEMADTNSNLDLNSIGGNEMDNRDFSTSPASDILYNSTGVLIELDGFVPSGAYPYVRIISPSGEDGDGCDVDGIEVLP